MNRPNELVAIFCWSAVPRCADQAYRVNHAAETQADQSLIAQRWLLFVPYCRDDEVRKQSMEDGVILQRLQSQFADKRR